jgi:phosphatidylglycerol:prolipoprotein diacylglycerol transferase
MFPILFKIGPVTIYTYGLLAATGFAAAVVWAVRSAPRFGLSSRFMMDLGFYIILSALVGSRLLFIILAWDYYKGNPLDMLKFWQGGLVFYGGVVLALIVSFFYVRYREQPFMDSADAVAPGLALGQAIGRLGCLAAGCCYGLESDLPWAITFGHEYCAAPTGISLHPTQLYSSISLLAVFGLTAVLQRRRRFPGQVFWTYTLLHGLLRPFQETFRGDFRGASFVFGLTLTQTLSLSLALFSAAMLVHLWRRHEAAVGNMPTSWINRR